MSDDQLMPVTSAMHGITATQNVSRAVAERIAEIQAATNRSRVMAWTFMVVPALAAAGGAILIDPLTLFVTIYGALFIAPIGVAVHYYRRRASREAAQLDRSRDVAWVSPKDGLVFFSDEGVFVEKRGGFKPYGVETRRFRDVSVNGHTLALHGMDRQTGTTYSMEIRVPHGWTDEDTLRVREKLNRFGLG